MAAIQAFARIARLRADHSDMLPPPPPRGDAPPAVGAFRWAVDPDSGRLVCRFLGQTADPDPLSRMPRAA
ncbi:hypothetical protein GALL_292380 [mine drainage metagenome]|uniref:Uncharacterized protein n=1 Tax=mine drainage metagenome TaxID=410659 RepID=A0A1J5QYS1_9ZZZZ